MPQKRDESRHEGGRAADGNRSARHSAIERTPCRGRKPHEMRRLRSFKATLYGYLHTAYKQAFCKRRSFGFPKAVFRIVKGGLLQAKRPPFTMPLIIRQIGNCRLPSTVHRPAALLLSRRRCLSCAPLSLQTPSVRLCGSSR